MTAKSALGPRLLRVRLMCVCVCMVIADVVRDV